MGLTKKQIEFQLLLKLFPKIHMRILKKTIRLAKLKGVVTKIMDYGCFVKIEDGIEGLVHNSELDWTNRNIKPSKVLSVSQTIKFKIVNIEKETKRISLSYKATLDNPWDKIKNQI